MVEDLLAASHTKTRQTCECEMSKKEDAIKKELLRLLFSPSILLPSSTRLWFEFHLLPPLFVKISFKDRRQLYWLSCLFTAVTKCLVRKILDWLASCSFLLCLSGTEKIWSSLPSPRFWPAYAACAITTSAWRASQSIGTLSNFTTNLILIY